MDINQNQQINTFLKGMNTDTSDALISNDQYRYAENVRVITNTDSNSGELRLVDGTTIFSYVPIGHKILATNYIRNIGVIITKGKANNKDAWWVYKFHNPLQKEEPIKVFGPCYEPIWVDEDKKDITTVLRYESDKNIKLYIADSTGLHSLMSLNIADEYKETETFDDVFGYQNTLLPALDVKISDNSGHIMSGIVQYAYRLYSKYGSATPISVLSKPLSLYKNKYSGYASEKYSGRAVDITYPTVNKERLNYIQVYRISYQLSGQLPKIHIIKDELLSAQKTTDIGTDVEEVSVDDFLSLIDTKIFPKQIESKGDYLFAANLKYEWDDVDKQFSEFDARCYNSGSYAYLNGQKKYIYELGFDFDKLEGVSDLKHDAFPEDSSDWEYDSTNWSLSQGGLYFDGWIGIGKCLRWKFIYGDVVDSSSSEEFSANNQTGTIKSSKSTFRCGEVYRFGIRLFNDKGQHSSVKWIADIMIPPAANMYTDDEDVTHFQNVGIRFEPTYGSEQYWKNVTAYEIVRCERTLADRRSITQGIVGHTSQLIYKGDTTNLLCTPGFFTFDDFLMYNAGNIGSFSGSRRAIPNKEIVMFASPEYCYQQDDISDILNSYQGELKINYDYNYSPKSKTDSNEIIPYSNQSRNETMSLKFYKTNHTYRFDYVSINEIIAYQNPVNARGRQTQYEDGSITRWYLNYFTPDFETFSSLGDFSQNNIENVSFIDSPEYSDFANSENLVFKNNVVQISNTQFINWSCPLLLNVSGDEEVDFKYFTKNTSVQELDLNNREDDNEVHMISCLYPIGAGGKTILLKLNGDHSTNVKGLYTPSVTVASIKKPATPYGGYNTTSINNSTYISLGDVITFNDDKSQGIDIFSGDTKIRIFTYHALHNWYSPVYKNIVKMGTVYAVPVETDIDIQAQYGDLYGVGQFSDYRVQDKAAAFDSFVQEHDAYLYNTAYNATPDILTWSSEQKGEKTIDNFDTRIHYSDLKTNNELIDSWTQFKSMNFLDVDSRFGQITDLKLFKDKLIFWQENATGLLAVNERVVLNDQNDTQVVLGTGGVLERYDYFTTVYGQKPDQHARAVSNDSLYWWDGTNKEILLYQQKYETSPLSTQKSVKNYINEHQESDIPSLVYDNKYKEILINVVNNNPVVYNEQIQQFTSVYTFNPVFDFQINGDILLTNRDSIYKYNSNDDYVKLFEGDAHPLIKYVINNNNTFVKTFDIQTFGGRFYEGVGYITKDDGNYGLKFDYKTPLKQHSYADYEDIVTDREYDFRLTIPRDNPRQEKRDWGDRMRGKTMQCEFKSATNNKDFSLQYITTKFRTSWT